MNVLTNNNREIDCALIFILFYLTYKGISRYHITGFPNQEFVTELKEVCEFSFSSKYSITLKIILILCMKWDFKCIIDFKYIERLKMIKS